MSLKQLYESDLLAYDEKEDRTYPYRLFRNNGGGYVQELWFILGLFVRPETDALFKDTISAFVVVRDRQLSASFDRYDFNLSTGAFIRRVRYNMSSGLVGVSRLSVSTGRVIWSLDNSLHIRRRDPNTMEPYGDIISLYLEPRHFQPDTVWGTRCFAIDELRDRVALAPQGPGWGNLSVSIHRLSDGELLYHTRGASIPHDMFFDDDARLYVIGYRGLVTVIDYLRGRPLGVLRVVHEQLGGYSWSNLRTAWDYRLRRILVLAQTAEEANGAATSRIRGYFPRALPVGITPPVPLKVPRKGENVPILAHVYTAAGAPLGGRPVTATFGATFTGAPQQLGTDGFGNALFTGTATEAGTVEVNMETPDL